MTSSAPNGLPWPPLIPGILVRRYKRFMADVQLQNNDIITAHCPNTGSMAECCEPGRPVYVSFHNHPKRKLKYTWQLIDMRTSLVGVNTLMPNRLVFDAIQKKQIKALQGYDTVVKEVTTGPHSRIDLMLTDRRRQPCYIEIKNCTLVLGGTAYFPDAVTSRGKKHLVELQRLAASANRCIIFFLIQRMDADVFKPAEHVDPDYCMELRRAVLNGVEVLAYDVSIDLHQIGLRRPVPVVLPDPDE